MSARFRLAIYALGGGHGHAIRGALLAKSLAKINNDATVLVREDNARLARALGAAVIAIPRPTNARALADELSRIWAQLSPDLVVMDTFPEGLLAEMRWPHARPAAPTIGLLRLRKDLAAPDFLRAREALRLALDLEDHLHWLDPRANIEAFGPPCRFSPADESYHPTTEVRILPGGAKPCTWSRDLGQRLLGHGIDVKVHNPLLARAELLDPLKDLSAKVVVGPAGFNLYYELQALKIPHIAIPQPRRFDDQWRRAGQKQQNPPSTADIENKILRILANPSPKAPATPQIRTRSFDELAQRIDSCKAQMRRPKVLG